MTKEEIKIRKATEADYQVVNSLYFEFYTMDHQSIPQTYKKTPKNPQLKGEFLNMLEDKKSLLLVATINDQIVGFSYAFIEKETGNNVTYGYHRVYIGDLYVLPNYHRRGVGSQLIQEVEKWAKDRKLSDLAVLVYNFNKNAADFYKKQGYEPYSTQFTKKLK